MTTSFPSQNHVLKDGKIPYSHQSANHINLNQLILNVNLVLNTKKSMVKPIAY